MSVINTNYLALVSQNNLNKSQNALGTAIERLSSGLRINSAKDDAAGQAIANRFTANINGLTQASRNANDGISIAQTTEGALNEINENLQRIRTLTNQAVTGTNSASDLKSIQAEISQRLDEIDRVSEQTQFNGVKVLAGDRQLDVQVGAHDGETISIDLKKIDKSSLGLSDFSIAGPKTETEAIADGDFKDGNGVAITEAKVTVDLKVDDKAVTGAEVVKDKNGNFFVKVSGTAPAEDKFYAVDAKDFEITDATTGTGGAPGEAKLKLSLSSSELSVANDGKSLSTLDKALAKVDSLRSDLGAIQNRFQSTIANLNNTVNNLSAARSRIEDADYAVEVSNMTRAQILQQAGTSVLAQANQVPQTVLSLLR